MNKYFYKFVLIFFLQTICSTSFCAYKKTDSLYGYPAIEGVENFAYNGTFLAIPSSGDSISLLDISKNKDKSLNLDKSIVTAIAFSPDKKTLAIGSLNNKIIIFDSKKGNILYILYGGNSFVTSLIFSTNGKYLTSICYNKIITLWNLDTKKIINKYLYIENKIKISFDGTTVVSFSPDYIDQKIKIWSLIGKKNSIFTTDHKGTIEVVAFSPDGTMLATGSLDRSIKIWNIADIANVTLVKTLNAHTDGITSLLFSPNNKLLISGSSDNSLRVWDCSDRNDIKYIKLLKGHISPPTWLDFSPDGNRFVSIASKDNFIIEWKL